jgi:cation diffusion facilitator family transporter
MLRIGAISHPDFVRQPFDDQPREIRSMSNPLTRLDSGPASVENGPLVHATPDAHYREAMLATALGLVVNFALGLVKLAGGLAGQSFALIADSINSLGDSVASVVTIAALWFAQVPPDEEHPYGHTRAESVAALFVALLILASGFFVGWEAISRLGDVHVIPPIWTLWIAGANVAIKEALFWFNRHIGRRTGSSAILANAWDHRSDALCSLAVLVGLGAIFAGGTGWIWADEASALVVAAAIAISGTRLLLNSVHELLDPQADEAFVAEIRASAADVPGVLDVEKLWVRKTGIEYLVDIHIQVDPQMTVAEGHRISHAVRDRLVSRFAPVRAVLVHLEPYEVS